jgi:hypothetical protein
MMEEGALFGVDNLLIKAGGVEWFTSGEIANKDNRNL